MILSIVTILLVLNSLWIYKAYRRKIHIWFPAYVMGALSGKRHKRGLRHIMFMFVDHFEAPLGEEMIGPRRIADWVDKYPKIVKSHRDSDGICPRHTWFYAAEKFDIDRRQAEEEFSAVSGLCSQGFGEIEFHLHHKDDTPASLKDKIEKGLKAFNRKAFAFIHGGWALDNSIKGCCGVNNELEILKDAGCFADFTFPAFSFAAQPKKINSIYYAKDDPDKPKSYDTGVDVEVGKAASGDLMIVEGPLTIDWKNWKHVFYPKMEFGDISKEGPPTPGRIDQWIKCNIHVKGRPEWVFVKIYCHGCYDSTMQVVFGDKIQEMFGYLEDKYNDGVNYKLHYVTTREAYNIIKAAEAGLAGNPGEYRDYMVKQYTNEE